MAGSFYTAVRSPLRGWLTKKETGGGDECREVHTRDFLHADDAASQRERSRHEREEFGGFAELEMEILRYAKL